MENYRFTAFEKKQEKHYLMKHGHLKAMKPQK